MSDCEESSLRAEYDRLQKRLDAISLVSSNPVLEINNLREQVMTMSSRCAELEGEISLLHMTRSNSGPSAKRDKGKFQPEDLVQSLMEAKPMLSEGDHALLRLIVPIVDRMWNGGQAKAQTAAKSAVDARNTALEVRKRDEEILKLRKEKEALKEKLDVFEMSLDTLTNENMKLQQTNSELEAQRENLILELAEKEEETEEFRPVIKQKYQLECEKQELHLINEKLQRQFEKIKKDMEELTLHSVSETQKLAEVRDALIAQVADLTAQLQAARTENTRLSAVDAASSEKIARLECAQKQAQEEFEELQKAKEALRSLTQDLEDSKTEQAIYAKKSLNEIRMLKNEIARERTQCEELRDTYEKCKRELERIQDVKAAHARVAAASISEKKFVETLREQISELQRTNQLLEMKSAHAEEAKNMLMREMQSNEALKKEIAALRAAMPRNKS